MSQSDEYGGTVSIVGCDLSYRVEGAAMPLLVAGSSTFIAGFELDYRCVDT